MNADTGSMTAYDTLILDDMVEAWFKEPKNKTFRQRMAAVLAAAEAATVPCTECGGTGRIEDVSAPADVEGYLPFEACYDCTDGRRSALDVHRERKP